MTRYVTASTVERLRAELSDRERAVVITLRRVRVATAEHLTRLHGLGITQRHMRRLLAGLTEKRLIARIERQVGGRRAGSSGWVYALDVAGQRILDSPRTRRRPWTPGQRFVAHALAVTDLYVRLVEAERAGTLEVIEFTTEPDCWRTFTGPGGGRSVLKPDAHAVVGIGEYADHYFLEVDRGTVSRSTLTRQAASYVEYWRSGVEQERAGVFPQVMWVVPDEARKEVVAEVFATQPTEAWQLFGVVTEAAALRVMGGGKP